GRRRRHRAADRHARHRHSVHGVVAQGRRQVTAIASSPQHATDTSQRAVDWTGIARSIALPVTALPRVLPLFLTFRPSVKSTAAIVIPYMAWSLKGEDK